MEECKNCESDDDDNDSTENYKNTEDARYATNDLYEFGWRNLRFLYSFYPD